MRVYAFFGKNGRIFQVFPSIVRAVAAVRGDESRVFVHSRGIPNPWFVHPVKNGKVVYDKLLKYSDLEKAKKKFKTQQGLLD